MTVTGSPRRFDGRVALVTRAGSAIGTAAAARFEHEGAHVYRFDGDGIMADDRRRVVADCLERHGGLHILIVTPPAGPSERFLDLSAEAYRRGVDAGLKTTYFMVQEVAREMASEGGAICVGSPIEAGRRGPDIPAPGTLLEGGIVALTRMLAVELAPAGIRVNAVCPVGTAASPDEVAAAFAFLASDEASYVSGAFIPVPGVGSTQSGALSSEAKVQVSPPERRR